MDSVTASSASERPSIHDLVTRWIWPIAAAIAIALLVVLTYGNSITRHFHYDDRHAIEENPSIATLKNIPRFFANPKMFDVSPDGAMYRPLVLTTFAIDHTFSGDRAEAFHTTNLILHAIASILLFFVLRKVLGMAWPTGSPDAVAFVALALGLAFAAHPANSEAVNYVSARSSLLAGIGLMTALLAYLHETGPAIRPFLLAGTGAAFFFSLLSRETAVVFPLAAIALDFAFRRGGIKRRFVPWMTLGFIAIAYLGIRRALFGTIGVDLSAARWAGGSDPYSGAGRDILTHLLSSLKVYFIAAWMYLVPSGLSVCHDVTFVESFFQWSAILASFGLLVTLLSSVLFIRRAPLFSFGALWFVLFMLPTNSVLPLNVLFQEHRSYVPAMGLLIVSADPLFRLTGYVMRRFDRRTFLAVASLAALCLIVTLAGVTHLRNQTWSDDRVLWEDAVAKSPENPRALHALGLELQRIGRFDDSEKALERAVQLRPQNAQARLALAHVKEQNGKESECEEMLKTLCADFPRSAVADFELGLFYQRRQKLEPALDAYTKAVQNEPTYADAHLNLGWLYQGLHRDDDALKELRETLRLEPNHPKESMILETIERIEHPPAKKPKKGSGEGDDAGANDGTAGEPSPEPPHGDATSTPPPSGAEPPKGS